MTRSRIAALSIVVLAALGVTLALAGCGSSKGGEGSPGAATQESTSESSSTTESAESANANTSEGAAATESGSASEGGAAKETGGSEAGAGGAASGPASVTTKSNKTFGKVLAAGPNKLTLYMFAADHGSESTCYTTCATTWPPLTTKGKAQATGGASAKQLGLTKRTDGTTQVTYAGHPLYYYAPDKSESDVLGQAINSDGGLWYMVSPNGEVIKTP